jgi:DNA polymerase-3 subunit epsilon
MRAKSTTLWLVIGAVALAQAAIVAGAGFNLWSQAPSDLQAGLEGIAGRVQGFLILGSVCLVLVPAVAIGLLFRAYVAPLRAIAEELQLIALTNPRHRLAARGPHELGRVVDGINLVADRYQHLQEDLEQRISDAAAVLEEERDTLAALMSKISQGVIVCNMEGRVLLYNTQARHLLEGPERDTGAGDWIGLGRSIYTMLDEGLVRHALMTLIHGRQRGEVPRMVPFVATRPGGQVLNIHLVPISGKDRRWHGYLLTLDDATERIVRETRRVAGLRGLIEGQRSAVSGIRAGIEAMLTYRDMEDDRRLEFEKMILDEAMRLSAHFEGLEDEIGRDLSARISGQDLAASDLLAGVERHVQDVLGLKVAVSVPIEPIRLKVESYAIARSFIFLVDQVRRACRGEAISIALKEGASLCALDLQWSGAPLAPEALRAWGLRNVFTDTGGSARTLFEVIEQHSGAIWALPEGDDGRPCLRVLLPLADGEAAPINLAEEAGAGHDFDFRLSSYGARISDPATAPLGELSYTVIDTETTGLFPERGDEIISVAAVRVVRGRILRREVFDSLVNPQRPISPESEEIHGISSSMVRGAPLIEDVLPRLAKFVEDTVLVGHNIAFDLRFFLRKAETTGTRFTNLVLDTFFLERIAHPNQEDKRLDAIAERLGVKVIGRHSALGDALTTAEIFLALIPILAENGIVTLKQAIDACAPELDSRLKR